MLSVLFALFFPPVPVEPAPETPKGPPPQIVSAKVDKDGSLVATRIETVYVIETRTGTRIIDGKTVQVTYNVHVPVMRTVMQRWSLEKATITEAGGKKLDKKTLAKRLTKPTLVVVSNDGRPIDAGYLELFKKDTIVIVAPGAVGPAPEKLKVPKKPIEKKEIEGN